MKDRKISHSDIALMIFNSFKSPMYYDEMIYKVIPHHAYKSFGIDDMTDEDIQKVKDILIAIDSSIGNPKYDF